MTVNELISEIGLEVKFLADGERRVSGGYCGDMLSRVMSRAETDQAWITIMSNVNIIAVATLSNPSCIILAEGVEPDADAVKRAEIYGVNLLSSDLTAYELAGKLYGFGRI